jgi:hypothetical protein
VLPEGGSKPFGEVRTSQRYEHLDFQNRANDEIFAVMRYKEQQYYTGNRLLSLWQRADMTDIERYFELLKDAKVKGYLFAQQNYVDEQFKKQ